MVQSEANRSVKRQSALNDIAEIRRGQNTPKAQRHRMLELEDTSFSIIYGSKKNSLDLTAKCPNEYRIWVLALERLVECRDDTARSDSLKAFSDHSSAWY